MRPRSWTSVYVPLATAAVVVCCVFWRVLGAVHVAAVAALTIVAPLALALLGGNAPQDVEPGPKPQADGKPKRWLIAAILALAAAKLTAVGALSSGFVPALHDEWSYLFGAQTLALGRVANSTPTDLEFFDAFHILAKPHWMTRYPPGHPAALAIGILCGLPWIVPVVLSAGTVVWTYLLGRATCGERAGRLAAILAIFSPGLDYLASGYLSQSTFLFAITGCFVCLLGAVERASSVLAVTGGVLGGWAILARPYSAVVLGAPLATWFVFCLIRRGTAAIAANDAPASRAKSLTCLASGIAPVLCALGVFAAYNAATTGNPLRTAWGEYNRQFEPDNSLGFGGAAPRQIPDGVHFRKRPKAEQIAREKQAFTWQAAIHRAIADPTRLSQMAFPALGFYGLLAFLPFAWRGDTPYALRGAACPLVLAAIAAHYVAYSLFYSTWGVYGHETIPFVIALVAAAIDRFWVRARDSDRPMLVFVVPLAVAAAFSLDAFVQLPRFIEQRAADTAEHRKFDAAVRSAAQRGPILVFVQIDPAALADYDLIHNSPDLGGSVVVALDLGDRNEVLVRRFPERRPFVYEQATGALRPWVAPAPSTPARYSDRSDRQVATWRSGPRGQ